MANVFRPTYTKSLPANAELASRDGKPFASWADRSGKKRTAPVTYGNDGRPRIRIQSNIYSARFRDGSNQLVERSTGCRTRQAAMTVLAEWINRAEKVRCGAWSVAEDAVLDHQSTPISDHMDAYLDYLANKRGKGHRRTVSPKHVSIVSHNLRRIVEECRFKHLREVNRSGIERWIRQLLNSDSPPAARTINAHLVALTAFCNWCVDSKRLVSNPVSRPPKLDETADRRRRRRAMTEDELVRLLQVAALRPLAEYGRESVPLSPDGRQGRRTWQKSPLTWRGLGGAVERARVVLANRPDFIAELERTGRERALIYKTLVCTGLRKGELASITLDKLDLESDRAFLTLDAANDKAGRGAEIPLRRDLVNDLRQWLTERLDQLRSAAQAAGDAVPTRLPFNAPLFNVPTGLIRILDRDLAAACIAKCDERGFTVDVHAMRHTFGTHLSKSGVAPRTAQAAMRHSSIDLTMNTYTDPRLLDVHAAIESLPALSLDPAPKIERARLTGTDSHSMDRKLARNLALIPGQRRGVVPNRDKSPLDDDREARHVSDAAVKHSERMTRDGEKRATRVERATFSLEG